MQEQQVMFTVMGLPLIKMEVIMQILLNLNESCSDYAVASSLRLFYDVFKMVSIIVPIILIISVIVSLVKLMINPDDKKGLPGIYRKVIAAFLIFLLPNSITTVVNLYNSGSNDTNTVFNVLTCFQSSKKTAESITAAIYKEGAGTEKGSGLTGMFGDLSGLSQYTGSSSVAGEGAQKLINIAIGVAVGVAVMAFLVLPAVSASRQSKVNKQTVKFSDQIATQKSQISALKKELDNYRSSSKEAENQQQTAEITKTSYESLMTVISHYSTGDMSNSALAEELLKINSETLGASGKEEYDTLTGKIYPRVCESLYVTSQKNYQVANYDTAVTNLEQVVQMDEGYQDGVAMLLLAQSYEKQGKQDKANTYYQKIIEKYNGTEAATEAQNALDVQNAKKTKDNNN